MDIHGFYIQSFYCKNLNRLLSNNLSILLEQVAISFCRKAESHRKLSVGDFRNLSVRPIHREI